MLQERAARGATLTVRPLAVVDVGSNTIRLLVGCPSDDGGVDPVFTEGVRVGLGHEIETDGAIPAEKLDEAADVVAELCRLARANGAESVDLLVTAPGRQAENADELLAGLRDATGLEPTVLSREEEGRLAFTGALSAAPPAAPALAVVDLGGASTEVAVGRPDAGVSWVRSFDLGALRLTSRLLAQERPPLRDLDRARTAVSEAFAALTAPLAGEARAFGGSVRALTKLVGRRLGADELDEAVEILGRLTHEEIAAQFGVRPERAPLLLAAALILAEVQARLVVPLDVVDSGLREGALIEAAAAAAAERVA
jgi:exopolyphosphatase/guanosine-5'-triphosphate,3'-diphosphate pyrophosphatase